MLVSRTMIEVSLIIPARNSSHALEKTVKEAYSFFFKRLPHRFEIIIVPNSRPNECSEIEIAEQLVRSFPGVVHCQPHLSPPLGKGAAIKTGFLVSKGKWIFYTDADLPYDLSFFEKSLSLLESGVDLVSGNRRLPESRFYIPVPLLPLAYGRHRLGIAFNRMVRLFLPIQTKDTQAGIKAFSRRLASETFKRQSCPGFLFDIELFLTAIGHNYILAELPVTLYLNSEKTTVKVFKECFLVGYWMSRIFWQYRQGAYSPNKNPRPLSVKKLLKYYQTARWKTRFFLALRWLMTPYAEMASQLPNQGRLLDLGCGHGLFSLTLALLKPRCEVVGVDHDSERTRLAQTALKSFPSISIQNSMIQSTAQSQEPGLYSGMAMIDILHYFEFEDQERLLKESFRLLSSQGILIIREVNQKKGLVSLLNQLYEKMATTIGFTKTNSKQLFFRSCDEFEIILKKIGYQVKSKPCSHFLFQDILYICERP